MLLVSYLPAKVLQNSLKKVLISFFNFLKFLVSESTNAFIKLIKWLISEIFVSLIFSKPKLSKCLGSGCC